MQVTAKSRREYKHRRRVVGLVGRRHNDQERRTQMVVGEELEGVYYHTLPKPILLQAWMSELDK